MKFSDSKVLNYSAEAREHFFVDQCVDLGLLCQTQLIDCERPIRVASSSVGDDGFFELEDLCIFGF